MNSAAQLMAIAQACGLEVHHAPKKDDQVWVRKEGDMQYRSCPNYLGSLDACAEMERVLDQHPKYLRTIYVNHLNRLVGMDTWYENNVRASAPQRCEAFLRTLGLWDDKA